MFHQKENEKDLCLLTAWKAGNQEACETLLLKYMPLIMKCSIHHYNSCGWEDLRQELILVFLEMAKKYTTTIPIPFSTYIKKKMYWARADFLEKMKSIDTHESLNIEEQEEGTYEMDMLAFNCFDIEKISFIAHLTTKQHLIFPMWLEGYTVVAIHQKTHLSKRSIQILIQNIRKALHNHSAEISQYMEYDY